MSFTKAIQLLRVADLATSRFDGVSLDEVAAEFDVSHRTAQRMMQAFESVFPAAEFTDGADDRRRRWRLPKPDMRWLHAQSVRDSELAALDLAIQRARQDGMDDQARSLEAFRDRALSMMPKSMVLRAGADAEALLEAQGYAFRPGPRASADPVVVGAITDRSLRGS